MLLRPWWRHGTASDCKWVVRILLSKIILNWDKEYLKLKRNQPRVGLELSNDVYQFNYVLFLLNLVGFQQLYRNG